MPLYEFQCKKCGTRFVISDAPIGPSVAAPSRPCGEDGIPLTWEPGDTILDLYEVRPFSETKKYIEGESGAAFDPEVVAAFLRSIDV